MKIKIEVEMSERDAKDLDTAMTQIFRQVRRLAVDINGLLQLDKVRNAIVDAIITPTEIEIEDALAEGEVKNERN